MIRLDVTDEEFEKVIKQGMVKLPNERHILRRDLDTPFSMKISDSTTNIYPSKEVLARIRGVEKGKKKSILMFSTFKEISNTRQLNLGNFT